MMILMITDLNKDQLISKKYMKKGIIQLKDNKFC